MTRAGVALLLLSCLAALAACSTMGEPGPYSDALPSYTPSSIPTATPGPTRPAEGVRRFL